MRLRNALLFAFVSLLWLTLDQLTKSYFNDGSFAVGERIGSPFAGLFRFTLVHNTGGAWGIFGGSTVPLAVVSLAVCVFIVVFAFVIEPRLNVPCIVGLALVFAGGIGNAIDRFAQGYVTDFIDLAFIDFPVFNIADIGVTCGIALFFICYLLMLRSKDAEGCE